MAYICMLTWSHPTIALQDGHASVRQTFCASCCCHCVVRRLFTGHTTAHLGRSKNRGAQANVVWQTSKLWRGATEMCRGHDSHVPGSKPGARKLQGYQKLPTTKHELRQRQTIDEIPEQAVKLNGPHGQLPLPRGCPARVTRHREWHCTGSAGRHAWSSSAVLLHSQAVLHSQAISM